MKIPLKRYWHLLRGYLRPQWPRVLALALTLAVGIALQLLNPQILRHFIDTATGAAGPGGAGQDRALTDAALLFIGVALAGQLLSVLARYLSENIGWTATNALRVDLAAHCLGLDLSFHKAHTPGEVIERVDGDVNALSNFFSQFIIDVLSNLVLLLGVLVLLWREDPRVGLGLSLFALAALAILIRLRSLAVPYWAAVRAASASFYGALSEHLAGTEDLRANGATGYALRRFTEGLRAWLPVTRKAGLAGYTMWMTTLAVFAVGHATALGLGAALWRAGAITVGTVYMIFYYTELLRRPIERIRTQMEDLQKADASIGRIEELFAVESRVQDAPGEPPPLPSGPLAVELRGVTFGYDGDAPVLRDLSLRLAPGRTLGLLGRTGSGKTTLARLLPRLYDPDVGEVLLGGVPLRAARLADLRARVAMVAMVTQDVQLFAASVRDNLTFFDPSVPDERLVRALHDLGLDGWYRSLPAGLDTALAPDGGGLSAGEAQLLAFVRVFLKDPGLVILDEASSRLDPATEALVDRAVRALLHGRTGIVIAHRLGTVAGVDEIVILEDGRILERGDREALAADPASHFHGLLRSGAELAEVLA